jgi:hypothetical protein
MRRLCVLAIALTSCGALPFGSNQTPANDAGHITFADSGAEEDAGVSTPDSGPFDAGELDAGRGRRRAPRWRK